MPESGSSTTRLSWILVILFAVAMVMGPGPGMHLVNRAETVPVGFGIRLPLLYAWALAWYAVQAVCIIVAYLHVWREPQQD